MNKGRDNKPHIGIFGRRNQGKSSLINLLTGQQVAIVSDTAGTTTDPVKKSVEIFGIGPVVIIDTAGMDDNGDLGRQRVKRSEQVIPVIDLAVLVLARNEFGPVEERLIEQFRTNDVPYVIWHNKSDLMSMTSDVKEQILQLTGKKVLHVSAFDKTGLEAMTVDLRSAIPETAYVKPSLFGGLISKGDLVVLVTPIDSEAPEGRMILPQQMAIRDVLDNDAFCLVVKETELEAVMKLPAKPALVVTDSQAFGLVSQIVPEEIPLTGFSVLFARLRANFQAYLEGTPAIGQLRDNDKVLMLESCTHHVSCEDIGRYKLPNWIRQHTGKELHFDMVSGLEPLPEDLSQYSLVIQCGGCMVTRKQLGNRIQRAVSEGVPVANYGMAIAFLNGVFDRVTRIFMENNR